MAKLTYSIILNIYDFIRRWVIGIVGFTVHHDCTRLFVGETFYMKSYSSYFCTRFDLAALFEFINQGFNLWSLLTIESRLFCAFYFCYYLIVLRCVGLFVVGQSIMQVLSIHYDSTFQRFNILSVKVRTFYIRLSKHPCWLSVRHCKLALVH